MVALFTIILTLAAPVPEENAAIVRLFAEDAAYRNSPTLEARYEGLLEFVPGQAGLPGRYRLLATEGEGKAVTHELYLPRMVAELGPCVGQVVRIVGKATERGLWPGRLERVTRTGGLAADGILARSSWQPAEARRISRSLQTYVFRSGEQARQPLGLSSAEAAAQVLARDLRVPEIDWNKQMVVCVAVGLKTDVGGLTITRVVAREGTLTVYYRQTRVGEGKSQGFGYPAETVLVPRFDGNLRFEEELGR